MHTCSSAHVTPALAMKRSVVFLQPLWYNTGIKGGAPVGSADNAVNQVVVHELEGGNVRRPQVQVHSVVLTHTPQILAVSNPGQRVDKLTVARRGLAKA